MSLEPPRPGSAAELHLREIAHGLEREGWDVATLWRRRQRGVRNLLGLLTFQLGVAAKVRRFDVLYLRWHPLGLLMTEAARVAQVPYVLEVNGTVDDMVLAHPRAAFLRAWLLRAAGRQFRGAAQAIAVAPGLAHWVEQMAKGRTKATFLHNGAPEALAHRATEARTPPYAVFFGELALWQGIDTLLDSRRSRSWPAGVRLVVAGDGTLREAVAGAHDDGLVDYVGKVPRDAAHDLLAGAIASISPQTARVRRNLHGVSPMKVSESLMLGVPPIVSALPGQRELVAAAPVGFVVEPDDPEAVAAAVRAALDVREEQRSALREYATDTVSWRTVAERTSRLCTYAVERPNDVGVGGPERGVE